MAELLQEGKKVRDRSVVITDGTKTKLSELTGRKGLVLYFYPKDMTPGCTTEACDFRDNTKRLTAMGYKVVGVSPDDEKSHQKFTEKQGINFPLISDTDKKLCEAFGVWGEKSLYGRKFMGVNRTTYVLGSDLKVTRVYPKVKVKGHVEQLIADLKS